MTDLDMVPVEVFEGLSEDDVTRARQRVSEKAKDQAEEAMFLEMLGLVA